MMWCEVAASLATMLDQDNDTDFRTDVFQQLQFQFCSNIFTADGGIRRWGTGVHQNASLYCTINADGGRVWCAEVFCFVAVEFVQRVFTVPAELSDSLVEGTLHLAAVRWLSAHPAAAGDDPCGRPICPGLRQNHSLWQKDRTARQGFRVDSAPVMMVRQLRRAGVSVRAFLED
jgi:hypothetical protein